LTPIWGRKNDYKVEPSSDNVHAHHNCKEDGNLQKLFFDNWIAVLYLFQRGVRVTKANANVQSSQNKATLCSDIEIHAEFFACFL